MKKLITITHERDRQTGFAISIFGWVFQHDHQPSRFRNCKDDKLFLFQQELPRGCFSVGCRSNLHFPSLQVYTITRIIFTIIILPEISSNEYIFLACPLRETSNTSRFAEVMLCWTETRNSAFGISFMWVQIRPKSWKIVIETDQKWNVSQLVGRVILLSLTPSSLTNSCFVGISTTLILLWRSEHQASRVGDVGNISSIQS